MEEVSCFALIRALMCIVKLGQVGLNFKSI